jgi:putative solute:sodium symporter small subunit
MPAPFATRQAYWRRTRRLTAVLLLAWFVVTFVVGWYARELSFNFFGWPFSFYMGAQGAPIAYLLIVWCYERWMNRLDRRFDVAEDDTA